MTVKKTPLEKLSKGFSKTKRKTTKKKVVRKPKKKTTMFKSLIILTGQSGEKFLYSKEGDWMTEAQFKDYDKKIGESATIQISIERKDF